MNVIRLECDFMTVKDLISTLKYQTDVELRENDKYLCNTDSKSKVLDVYGEREIINWHADNFKGSFEVYISINIKGESE